METCETSQAPIRPRLFPRSPPPHPHPSSSPSPSAPPAAFVGEGSTPRCPGVTSAATGGASSARQPRNAHAMGGEGGWGRGGVGFPQLWGLCWVFTSYGKGWGSARARPRLHTRSSGAAGERAGFTGRGNSAQISPENLRRKTASVLGAGLLRKGVGRATTTKCAPHPHTANTHAHPRPLPIPPPRRCGIPPQRRDVGMASF